MTQWAIEDGNISEASGTATNILSGLAKAWIIFDGTGTVASRDSFNVSSLTDDGVGLYTVGLTNNFASADYASTVGSTRSGSQAADRAASGQHATSSFLVHCRNTNTNSDADQDELSGVAHGDLA